MDWAPPVPSTVLGSPESFVCAECARRAKKSAKFRQENTLGDTARATPEPDHELMTQDTSTRATSPTCAAAGSPIDRGTSGLRACNCPAPGTPAGLLW